MPYSAYNYVGPTELPGLIPSMASVTNEDLAARFISDAEYMIDALAGPAPRFYPSLSDHTAALIVSGTSGLSANVFGTRRPNYWAVGGTYVRIVDSDTLSLVGQERLIVASSDNAVTLASGFDVDVPVDTLFIFDQRSAFPRIWDQDVYGDPNLPQLLKQAVAAQVEYGIYAGAESTGLGTPALLTDADGAVTQRSYGSGYSESRDPSRRSGLALFVAPRARALMQAGRLISTTGYTR